MRYRLIAIGFSLLAIVGVSVALAQIPAAEPAARALDPDVVAVRLILGIGDATPEDWTGGLRSTRARSLRSRACGFATATRSPVVMRGRPGAG